MTWWLRQRGGLSLLPATLVGFWVVLAVTAGTVVGMPSLVADVVPARLSDFACLAVSTAAVALLERRLPAVECAALRRVDRLDVILAVGFVLGAAAGALVLLSAHDEVTAVTAARNVLFFGGLALAAHPLLGARAGLVPVGWMLLSLLNGRRASNDPYPWVIVAEDAYVPHAALGAGLAFLGGVVALVLLPRLTARNRP
ncbi:hypothetical protein ABZ896_01495 [Streptomyces sp. NPDC047072]|uniref:hypothetical protein n=1 Tax=Streptomyces sp. NPDC047072 TaxID=3154809 RepID=UPI003404834D